MAGRFLAEKRSQLQGWMFSSSHWHHYPTLERSEPGEIFVLRDGRILYGKGRALDAGPHRFSDEALKRMAKLAGLEPLNLPPWSWTPKPDFDDYMRAQDVLRGAPHITPMDLGARIVKPNHKYSA